MFDWTKGEFFRPLQHAWLGKLETAYRSEPRKRFREEAEEAKTFYARSCAALWSSRYAGRFMTGAVKIPKFPISINKTFEAIAVMVPNLLWDVPYRTVTPKKRWVLEPETEQMLMQDPMLGQMLQQTASVDQMELARADVTAKMMTLWLNYTGREVPDGGLGEHAQIGIVDAFLTGRGVYFPRRYQYPAGTTTLTGVFREDPLDLLIDPDCRMVKDAGWIALRHQDKYWVVEQRFQMPKDSLKGRASLESSWHYGESGYPADETTSQYRGKSETNDTIVWYEIWSKQGPGTRFCNIPDGLKQRLEEVCGEYTYLAIASNVPYPLNCPPDAMRAGMQDDEVKQRFSWPIPTWTDGRWPMEIQDFYLDPDSPYPIPPLSAGMGWLKFMNVMVPFLCNRVYNSSRNFIAMLEGQIDNYKKYFDSGDDFSIIPVKAAVERIENAIKILEFPQTNMDAWKVVEMANEYFALATGLTPLIYGQKGSESNDRSAEETATRARAAGVRIQFLQKRIAECQSRLGALESFCARWFVQGQDLAPLGGQTAALLWDMFVTTTPPESIVREMVYEVAASSIRRPDRERDRTNWQQAMQTLGQGFQQYALASGDFEPWNAMVSKWCEFLDMNDYEDLMIRPQQDDEAARAEQEAQQQAQELEMAKLQAEAQGKQMDLQGKQMDIQGKAQLAELAAAGKVLDVQSKREITNIDTQAKVVDSMLKAQLARMKLETEAAKAQMELQKTATGLDLDARQKEMDLTGAAAQMGIKLREGALTSQMKIKSMKDMAKTKTQQAKQKPKPSAGAKR